MSEMNEAPKTNLKRKNNGVIYGTLAVIAIAGVLIGLRVYYNEARKKVTPKDGAVSSAQGAHKPVAIEVPVSAPLPAAWLDVNQPAALRQAAEKNAWMSDVQKQALGRGFASGWNAFFLSKGEDLKASFQGTVFSFVFDKLLAQPFSVLWFGGESTPSVPALIVDAPSAAAKAAFEAFEQSSGRGLFTATHCPGESAPQPTLDKDGKEIPPRPKHLISRWLVADNAVYAAMSDDRLVMATKPSAALFALCEKIAAHKRGDAALDLVLQPEGFGREAQSLAALVGLADTLRLSWDVNGERLMPKGLFAELAQPGRLASRAPSEDLLKLVPDDMAVFASLQLNLPQQLSQDMLVQHLSAGGVPTKAREVSFVWQPHGDHRATEVALLWGDAADEAALKRIFAGDNKLEVVKACNHLILSSTRAFAERLSKTCQGGIPSRANRAAALVAAEKREASATIEINAGTVMSQLMLEAFNAQHKEAAAEISDAKSKLGELPVFGFSGKVSGKKLIGEGFRS